ncbi:MAG: leucine-rich repeat domain-containing protein [Lachnospiraceae bacterium]|jgi:hypothetical protein|nr:leucine-rich repeat domain-containing protein [Lachnospiraceae bacterium]
MSQVLVWRAEEKHVFTRQMGRSFKERELILERDYRKIADEALMNNTKIRRLVIREPLREVGMRSFYHCSALRSLSLGGIQSIRKEAFSGCVRLKEAVLPGELSYLGRGAFSGCRRMESIQSAPDMRCPAILEESFLECRNLQTCRLPDSVQVISARAFYKCVSLNALKLPRRIRVIGREAFYQTGMNELELPKGLEVIEDSAFLKCSQLTYVRLPRSVKRIEKWAFHGCNRLKTLEIAHDPEFIGEWIINRSAAIRCVRGGKVDRYCQNAGFTTEYI